MKELQVGKKYVMRRFPSSRYADLHKVKVVGLYTMGDGTEIVSYTYNFPFTIREEMEKNEFLKNIATT